MRLPSAFAVALLALSLVVAPAVGAASGSTGVDAGGDLATLGQQTDAQPFEEADPHTVFEVDVTASGDARWSITFRYLLTSENETAAFNRFGKEVADGTVETDFSPQLFQRFADRAERWTGREMTVEAAGWEDPRIQPRESTEPTATTATGGENGTTTYVGELTYSFVWTNFAEVDGNTVAVGDAFGTENETWFNGLDGSSRFVLDGPPNHGVRNSPDDKGPQNGTLAWDGPATFEPGYLNVTYFELAGTDTTAEPPAGEGGLSSLQFIGLVAILVALAAGGAYGIARREADEPVTTPNGGQGATSDGDDGGTTPQPGIESATADGARDEAGAGGGPPAATGVDDADEDEVDEELLSDEERVLRLLDDKGGRMKQANIVKETGWSNAKVSQLLSGMADEEEIQKLRIGRENLITLPGESIGDFDEES